MQPTPIFLARLDAVRFLADVPSPSNRSDLNHPELEALLVQLSGEVAALQQTVCEQREAIARLNGLKRRPNNKPSGRTMRQSRPSPARCSGGGRAAS
jgi:hypothetical protein